MTNENETVAHICNELRNEGTVQLAERILSAYSRVVSKMERSYNRIVSQLTRKNISMRYELAAKDKEIARLKQVLEIITNYDLSSIEEFPLDDEDEIVVYAEGENGLGCSYNQLDKQQQRVILQSVNAIRKVQEFIARAREVAK